MRFDSNQAWTEAVASVKAHRAVMWPVAGVFFLLPGLIWVWFFSDTQAELMAGMRNQATASAAMAAMFGKVMPFLLVLMVIQAVGNLSLLGLLTDRTRPTVGQAIGTAARSLPTVIGAGLLIFIVYMVIGLLVGLVIGLIVALTKVAAIAMVFVVAGLVAMFWALTRLSLLLPVIVVDKVSNPITAITRAWGLTKGSAASLFLFYLLLLVAYAVIAAVVQLALGAVMGVTMMGAGETTKSSGALIAMGLIGGVMGAVVAVLLNAILAAVHRQLAGPSVDAYTDTFA